MKAVLRGNSTLEIVIALAVLTLTMSAVIVVLFGNQTIVVDAQVTYRSLIEAREKLLGGGGAATTYITQCKRKEDSRVDFALTPLRQQTIELTTFFADIATLMALGRDCDTDPPASSWAHPATLDIAAFVGKPTAVDALRSTAYVGGNTAPFLFIAQGGNFVSYANGFSEEVKINDLDAIDGYVFAAMGSTTKQVKIFDVSDPYNPALAATKTLSSCVTGSYPQGWRVYYFDNRLYVTTRETAGPEFHIFDVTDREHPFEYGITACKGFALQSTVNDFIVREQKIGGVSRFFAYLATQESDKELRVLDVTDPEHVVEVAAATKDLPDDTNGESVFAIGDTLYFGRQATAGSSELYFFDIKNPFLGAPEIASYEIGEDMRDIHVVGDLAYLATSKSGEELQIWNIKVNPATHVSSYPLPTLITAGIDWEEDRLYATSQGGDDLYILYDQY